MSVNMDIFNGFLGQIKTIGDRAQPTEMPDAERVSRAKQVFLTKIDKVAAMDLESCIHCGMCAEACHYYVSTQDPKYTPIRKLELIKRVYRRELSPLRWLHRLFTRDISARDLEDWQELVYDSCTECGRCSTICPMGINIAEMVNTNRQALAQAGLIPAELRAVEQEQCSMGTVFGVGADQLKTAAEQLRAEGFDVPVDKDKADVLVLTTVIDIMLFNDALRSTVKILNHLGLDWTFKSCAFEGANFGLLSGYENLQSTASNRIVEQAISCGAKTVIIPECGHAYPAVRWFGPNEYGKPFPFEVLAISEFLGREVEAGRLKLKPIGRDKKITYHDPCKVGRVGGVFDEPRAVFRALNVDLRETDSHGVTNFCCGGGAGVFVLNRAANLRQKAFGIKINQIDNTGADSVVTSCGSCRLNFLAGKQNANWNKDIESLVELVGDNLAD